MDQRLSNITWKANTQYLRQQGVSAGVVQWTQYGSETFGGESGWLASRMAIWMKQNPLWFGLYSDPDYFSHIDAPPSEQKTYLDRLLQKNKATLLAWKPWLDAHEKSIAGLYIPFELSDYYFLSKDAQRHLNGALRAFKQEVNRPVAISVFINGAMPPDAFSTWIASVQQTGVQVWLQNGRGTGALPKETVQRYIDVLPSDVGIIDEIFHQESALPFKARPMTEAEKQKAQIAVGACHPRLTFSFRYWRPMPFPLPIP
ncbi:DUF4434 domain-containing protein [Enterovibrio nigricans]|uniref:DUF4434 domain-containing protein n=1 Tax=Enterovibrio nigricans DSM 22720 TaxID=1121868 RepID=A0A1T4W916_9GAMM|nr:DUF4434 domain-containing protein [Enterovibrio nigricans]PKF48781.1 hypothetical protein AT251_23635 [Enterovibrio nigricans]SKA73794.1 hypothetical protein SAMN02745132_04828 [Enterovibrio nigricans DSM 22720]